MPVQLWLRYEQQQQQRDPRTYQEQQQQRRGNLQRQQQQQQLQGSLSVALAAAFQLQQVYNVEPQTARQNECPPDVATGYRRFSCRGCFLAPSEPAAAQLDSWLASHPVASQLASEGGRASFLVETACWLRLRRASTGAASGVSRGAPRVSEGSGRRQEAVVPLSLCASQEPDFPRAPDDSALLMADAWLVAVSAKRRRDTDAMMEQLRSLQQGHQNSCGSNSASASSPAAFSLQQQLGHLLQRVSKAPVLVKLKEAAATAATTDPRAAREMKLVLAKKQQQLLQQRLQLLLDSLEAPVWASFKGEAPPAVHDGASRNTLEGGAAASE
ncbi:uncharacterized protein LOC34624342 [Cyclospora cayetanensis]|uniref:Uncharacterized protein LOC34624342 n=1 Tax=Cyclospora cayetanensis TaxID=88456 RepID=A0A6P6S1U1_9EIME|nr:uncharacterized protein LOC34624342 [Cyclospora cayetanensis]